MQIRMLSSVIHQIQIRVDAEAMRSLEVLTMTSPQGIYTCIRSIYCVSSDSHVRDYRIGMGVYRITKK